MEKKTNLLFLFLGFILGILSYYIIDINFTFTKEASWIELASLFITLLIAYLIPTYIEKKINNDKNINDFFVNDLKEIEIKVKLIKKMFNSHFYNKKANYSESFSKILSEYTELSNLIDAFYLNLQTYNSVNNRIDQIRQNCNLEHHYYYFKKVVTSIITPSKQTLSISQESVVKKSVNEFLIQIRKTIVDLIRI